MKNIHVLPTDKPSRLWINNLLQGKLELSKETLPYNTSQNIYIISDEKIKEGDWYLTNKNTLCKCIRTDNKYVYSLEGGSSTNCKKIILTTDQDLIKDGVQAIDDEFLEWFVKNPSCEEVDVEEHYSFEIGDWVFKIIIPKEEKDYTALLQPVGTKQTAVEWLVEQICRKQDLTYRDIDKAKEMEKQQKGYNQEKVFEMERFRAIDFAKWFADFNGLTRDEKRVTKEHLETLYEKYLQTLGGGLLNK